MNGWRGSRFLKLGAMGLLTVVVFGWAVMSLWNWLLPGLTGWHTLGFVQALGLLALCRILFGGFGRGGAWRERWRARFEHMTPEERDRLRERFAGRCRMGSGPEEQSRAG